MATALDIVVDFSDFKKRLNYFFFTYKEQQAFLEDLYALVKDGVTPTVAIDTICQLSKTQTKMAAQDILDAISRGQGIADGMRGWFSYQIIEIVRAGENSGILLEALESAATTFGQRMSVINTFLKSMTYPAFVFTMSMVLLGMVQATALTEFIKLKPFAEWPAISQQAYYLGSFLRAWGWLCAILFVAVIVAIVLTLRFLTGPSRHALDRIPVFSWYRDATAARFVESLGLLINNGLILKKALNIMQFDASPYLGWHLLMMEYRLSAGKDNIADVLDTQMIRDDDLIRLRIIAKSKGFAHALISLGRRAKQHNVKRMSNVSKAMGVLFLAFSSGLILLTFASIYVLSISLGSM